MTEKDLGQLTVTATLYSKMQENEQFRSFVYTSLGRYMHHDWGDLTPSDRQQNDEAVKSGNERIHAAYIQPGTSVKIWIITEWDHSATTVLFPEEY